MHTSKRTVFDAVEQLGRFDGPPDQFLGNLLAAQCQIAPARGGAVLRSNDQGRPEFLAVYPELPANTAPPVWLARAAELSGDAFTAGKTTYRPIHSDDDLYGEPTQQYVIFIPLRGSSGVRGVSAFLVNASVEEHLEAAIERLELTSSLLSLYEMRLTLQRRQIDLHRLRMAMETLTAINEQSRFSGAAMAFCNEIAARWLCDRVSVGFVKGRYIHLKGTSHTEKFNRKMQLVQDIEAAMEECFDQDCEVVHPAAADAVFVNRSAKALSTPQAGNGILSLPLHKAGEPVGVVTIERTVDKPFTIEDIEALRLTCELCTAQLDHLHEHDKWIGAKAAAAIRTGAATLVGPKHTWAKIAAIAVCSAIIFLAFAKGTYKVEGPFLIEATRQQVLPAPFDGYLRMVYVQPGDSIEGNDTILAELETAELRLELAAAKAERMRFTKQADTAMRDGKTAEAQMARAEANKAAAQIALIEYRIAHARIISPLTGTVVKGDLTREIGSPVKTGDVLFEVAPLESLRAQLSVPEDEIAELTVDQRGELATASYPDRKIGFIVEHINPLAEVKEQKNVFAVRVTLDERPDWLRPGMEGLGKVSVGKRHYAWIWSRKLVNWIRMKLWI